MIRSYESRRSGKIGAACIALTFALAVSFGLIPGQARAQLGAGNVEELIEALESFQSDSELLAPLGAIFPGLGPESGELARARRGALKQAQKREKQTIPNRVDLNSAERILARSFCRGATDRRVADIVNLIDLFTPLEADYCQRFGDLVIQFGYNIFQGTFGLDVLSDGAIPGDYRLGIGDEVVVSFVGQRSLTETVTVDRVGRVAVVDLVPINAIGRTFDDFRQELERRVAAAFIGTEVFASVGSVRQMSVMVAGEVPRPGLQRISGLSNLIDAIGAAGGINKTGSLRQVVVQNTSGRRVVDLYKLVFDSGNLDLRIGEGDRIVVLPIGRTIAVAGDVKRPGIFEIDESGGIGAIQALSLAGGLIRPVGNRLTRTSFDGAGRELVEELQGQDFTVGDGDLLVIGRLENLQSGVVFLEGNVTVPGRRGSATVPTIGTLLRAGDALKEGSFLPFAVLQTRVPSTRARRYFPINALEVVSGQVDFSLEDGDRLIVLGEEEIGYLSSGFVQSLLTRNQSYFPRLGESGSVEGNGGGLSSGTDSTLTSISGALAKRAVKQAGSLLGGAEQAGSLLGGAETDGECKSLSRLGQLVERVGPGRFENAIVSEQTGEGGRITFPVTAGCNSTYEANADLLPFVLEHAVVVEGAVRKPGAYPVAKGVSLATLVSNSGGFTIDADRSRVEIVRFGADGGRGLAERFFVDMATSKGDNIRIAARDIVRIERLPTLRGEGTVLLAGEFARPGRYHFTSGQRLSEVIARAGGVTSRAYPFGAVFTRKSVRVAERVALRRAARELRAGITVAAAKKGLDPSAAASFADLAGDISEAPVTGRVVIQADPTVLQVRPELDVVLQAGDAIFMPKRPNSILVTGDVLSPGAQQFMSGKSVERYLNQAGGLQESADRRRIFVVFPNGEASPTSVSPFIFSSLKLPPGSTIVVPKDATPFDLLGLGKDLAAVLSQLALTAAALAVIND